LGALWYDAGPQTNTVRVDLMDVLTRMFQQNFFRPIHQWCQDHRVRFIGHLVEDNGAHAHHGYGAGHFFRMMEYFDLGGYDLVAQVVPGITQGVIQRGPWQWDAKFFYWTVARLARSASHLLHNTPQTLCETFGAYGWGLGLRDMFWITQWQFARGTTWFVPHAFSPQFPDPDCPPHFYAGGENPQWPWMSRWSQFVHRAALLLGQGHHVADVAVLYPAEAQWYGSESDLDDVGESLALAHFDYDIVPMELLADTDRCVLKNGTARLASEAFRVLVVPGLQALPRSVAARLEEFSRQGGRVVFVDRAPHEEIHGGHAEVRASIEKILRSGGQVVPRPALGDALRTEDVGDVDIDNFPWLQHYHVRDAQTDAYFLNNESVTETFDGWITLKKVCGMVECWDPETGQVYEAPVYRHDPDGMHVRIRLAPYQALIVVVCQSSEPSQVRLMDSTFPRVRRRADGSLQAWVNRAGSYRATWASGEEMVEVVEAPWETFAVTALSAWQAEPVGVSSDRGPAMCVSALGDWSQWWPRLSGTVRYSTTFVWSGFAGEVVLDLGDVGEIAEVRLNGHLVGTRVKPPYRWVVTNFVTEGENRLTVSVTNTLGNRLADDLYTRGTGYRAGLYGPVTLEKWVALDLRSS
jgi:hypothetical protein